MKKDKIITVTLDKTAATLLDNLAELDFEGNRSATMRRLIREACTARGITVAKEAERQTDEQQA